MNIPKVATAGQLCKVKGRAGSARSLNWAVTPHNESLHIMQSIFSPAARCTSVSLPGTHRRRDGGLKMDWTKPLHSG